MKKHTYSSIFAELNIKPIVSEDKDKYLSMASLEQLQNFIPNIDSKKNYDLLPVAFSACVVNRANKNRDIVDTDTAIKIYKTFINKPINVEHNRKRVIGFILNAEFSEFGSEKPLSLDDVKDTKKPFNITLGGVIWKNVDEDIADYIEESADPSSENYLKVSASWELGYTGFSIVSVPEGSKNLEDGTIITDKEEIEKIKGNLISFGGTGKYEGMELYRCPTDGVIAVGIGFTEKPAAEVKGVATEIQASQETKEEKKEEKNDIKENNTSQASLENVNENRNDMKITSLKDITDENLKVVKASAITDFVEEEINKLNQQYLSEKQNKENSEKEYLEKINKATEVGEKANKELVEVREELSKLQKVIAEKANEDLFSARMEEFAQEYELDDEDRSVIASQIKDLNEESFAEFKKNAKVFFKNRMKKKGDKEDKSDKKMKASAEGKEEVISDAIENAKKEEAKIPNTPSSEQDKKARWAKAFSFDNILVQNRR